MGLFGFSRIPEIDVTTLHGKMKQDVPPILVDVREPEEFEDGIIGGAVLMPLRQVARDFGKVTTDKSAEIVVYCHSGNRSQYGADVFLKAGYTNVHSLRGGILGWFRQGYPIAEKPQ